MDLVLVRFRELNASQSGHSPAEVVHRLLDQLQISIVQEPLRAIESSAGASIMYSITIYIADTAFVAVDRLKKKATNKACVQVYKFLEAESAKVNIKKNVQNASLIDSGFFSKTEYSKMEERPLAIELDRNRSSLLFSGLAEQSPHLPQDDQKLQQILATFKTVGHKARYQNYRFSQMYCSIIAIEGFRKFIGHSITSNTESLRNACENLKNYYAQTFGDPFGQNTTNLINHGDVPRNTFPLVEQAKQLSLPPRTISPQMASLFTASLSPCDLKWIDLINQFNSVFDSLKFPSDNMEDLLSKDSDAFHIFNSFHISENKDTNHVTTVSHNNLGTFHGVDPNSSKSREKALGQPFQYLLKLSGLFSSFNLLNQSVDGSVMETLIALNSETITVKVCPVSRILYKASITVGNLKHFDALASTEEQAQHDAFSLLVDYCQQYSDRIQSPNLEQTNPLFSRFSHLQQSGRGSHQGYTNYQGRAASANLPAIPSSMCNKMMQLLCNFGKVFKYNQPSQVIMEELVALDQKIFKFETKEICNRNCEIVYETKVMFISANFTGRAKNLLDARNKALHSVYKRLVDMSSLFRYLRKEYYPGMSETSFKDFKLQIVTHYEDVLKVKVRSGGQLGYRATVTLVHFCDIHGDSKGEEEAEIIAFRNLIDYMRVLISNISKSQEELEMEAKQVVPFVPIGQKDSSPMSNKSTVSFGSATALQTPQAVSNSANVYCKMQMMIELINHFKTVDFAGIGPLDIIRKYNQTYPSAITMTTNVCNDCSYVTAVQLSNIVTFYSCMEQQRDSERHAAHTAVDFIRSLMKLVADFNLYYLQQLEALEIMDKLRQTSAIPIKLNTITINGAKRLTNNLYCSTLQLSNVTSFCRIANEEMVSKSAVATDLVQYLAKLANSIH